MKTAHDVLGDKCIAITAMSCSFPKRELEEAKDFCEKEGIRHITVESEELEIEASARTRLIVAISARKNYLRKSGTLPQKRAECSAEGSNMDDNGDYRPGLQAVAELGVKSPLRHSELYKADIRALSKDLGLPTWEKQSFACLSSRFVYGETITKEKLGMVDKAEQLLLDLGFHQLRVRIMVHWHELKYCQMNSRKSWRTATRS